MKANLITVFNQLTSSELADYNLFEDLLSNHYEKIKYLYSLVHDIDLTKISKIYCKTSKSSLQVYIEPDDINYLNQIIYTIHENKHEYTFSDYFTLDVYENSGVLNVDITTNDDMEEGDIYAHRFI